MLSRTALLERHGLTDEALAHTYRGLFGLDVALGGEETVEKQLVRHRAWEESRPYVTGEMLTGSALVTPLPGARAVA